MLPRELRKMCQTGVSGWTHQIHQSQAVYLLCTIHQHAQNLVFGEQTVPQSFFVAFEGM